MFKITLLSGAALVVLALPAMAAETAAPAAAANANAPAAAVAAPAPAAAPAVAPAAEKPLRWDDNGDGFISKDEWLKHQTEKFDEIDGNKDGKVTRDEMKAHGQSMRQKMMEMRTNKAAPAPAAAPAAEPKK